jgi:hypothetical protein
LLRAGVHVGGSGFHTSTAMGTTSRPHFPISILTPRARARSPGTPRRVISGHPDRLGRRLGSASGSASGDAPGDASGDVSPPTLRLSPKLSPPSYRTCPRGLAALSTTSASDSPQPGGRSRLWSRLWLAPRRLPHRPGPPPSWVVWDVPPRLGNPRAAPRAASGDTRPLPRPRRSPPHGPWREARASRCHHACCDP